MQFSYIQYLSVCVCVCNSVHIPSCYPPLTLQNAIVVQFISATSVQPWMSKMSLVHHVRILQTYDLRDAMVPTLPARCVSHTHTLCSHFDHLAVLAHISVGHLANMQCRPHHHPARSRSRWGNVVCQKAGGVVVRCLAAYTVTVN